MKNADNTSTNLPTNSTNAKKTKSHPFWKWFWLTFLVVSLAYAWNSFYVPSNDVTWAYNMDSARKMAKDSDKNMLLFFTGAWCVPCKIMKREIFADKGVSKAINAQVVPIIIDVDDPNVQEHVKYYKAGGTPITIFTDPQGEVLDYAYGKIDKKKFLEMLNALDKRDSQVQFDQPKE